MDMDAIMARPAASTADSPPKAKGKTKAPESKRAKMEEGAGAGAGAASAPKRAKALKTEDKLDLAMKAYKWWDAAPLPIGIKWLSMEHAGVCFPPPYAPHGVKMRYGGAEVDLTTAQEEVATYYAGVSPNSLQLSTPKTAKVFNKNFWKEFGRVLGPGHAIAKFDLCDFEPIRAHLDAASAAKKAESKEVKDKLKEGKSGLALAHGYALVDGQLEKMGNYMVEPPGLFRGRGEHPKMGVLKRRISPEDITINVAHLAAVPACPLPGHAWKRVVHDPSVTWLAYWRDPVGDHHKYVFLAASSSFKGRADLAKYEKARRLVGSIDKIRAHYEGLLGSDDEFKRQSGTAMWIIDRLALRVGGEKDEDEADTVGCCSLRVEHLKLPEEGTVTFDFLGKDSMRYHNTVQLGRYGAVGDAVWKNLKRFTKKKEEGADVFDMLNPSRLNEQLNELMPGLSAKVFRTYNASVTLEKELENLPADTPLAEKVLEYNRANREVAILCNHQRSVPKSFTVSYGKMEERAKLYRAAIAELQKLRGELKEGKKGKGGQPSFVPKKSEEVMTAAAEAAALEGLAAYEAAKAVGPVDKDREKELKEGALSKTHMKRLKEEESHRWASVPSLDSVDSRLVDLEDKLDGHEMSMRDKDDNKSVALGTSKINYMDPRITAAWCKRVDLPIDKPFPKTLIDKFPWALGVPSTWIF